MATYTFTSLQFYSVLPFDPLADRIDFTGSGITAADLRFDVGDDGDGDSTISFFVGGKFIRLEMDPLNFSTGNAFSFTNSSVGLVGDNAAGIRDDDLANTLTGGSGDDIVVGVNGNDLINAGGGNDVIYGFGGRNTDATGNDTVDGGAGVDLIALESDDFNPISANINLATGVANLGTSGTWTISNVENLLGGAGNDTLVGSTAGNLLAGGDGNDSITGGDGDDALFGGWGSDTLDGGNGNDVLRGQGMPDLILGGAGDDTIRGYNPTTTLTPNGFVAAGDTVDGGAGNDTVLNVILYNFLGDAGITNVENLLLFNSARAITDGGLDRVLRGLTTDPGQVFDDMVTHGVGTAGANLITSEDGDSVMDGGAGNDILDGGGGFDLAVFDSASGAVQVTLNAQLGTGSSTGAAGNDVLLNLEGAAGGAFNDSISGAGNVGMLLGGGDGNDIITGGSGSDTILGEVGTDSLDGGAGNDWLSFFDANVGVVVNLGLGTNQVVNDGYGNTEVASNFENVSGSQLSDSLVGSSGANTIYGGQGNDTLNGGAGDDSLDGGGGIDTVSFAGTATGVSANLATGAVSGGAGSDTLANFENVVGGDGADTLTGSSGDNVFDGGLGADSIAGGAGFDVATYRAATLSVTVNLATGAVTSSELGNDTLSGIEAVYTGSGTDNLIGRSLSAGEIEILDGGMGANTITGGGGAGFSLVSFESATGPGPAGVTATMSAGTVTASGAGLGANTITVMDGMVGSSFADNLSGDANDNYFIGGIGNDSLGGGSSGNDWASYVTSTNSVLANLGSVGLVYSAPYGNITIAGGSAYDGLDQDSITGGVQSGVDTLTSIENLAGGAGNDTLFGSSGANYLMGGGGNDFFVAGQGNDTVDGGAGTQDQISFAGWSPNGVAVNLGATPLVLTGNPVFGTVTIAGGTALDGYDNDTVAGGVQHSVDTLTGIEQVRGTALGDYIRGSDTSASYTGRQGDPSNQYYLNHNNTVTGGASIVDTIDGGSTSWQDYDQVNYGGLATGISADLRTGYVQVMTAPFTFGPQLAQLTNIDAISGTTSADSLVGGSDSRVFNGVKLEFFQGGGGNDTIDGAGGIDWVDIFNPTQNVNIDLDLQWQIQSQGGANDGFGGKDQYQGIDGIRVLGTAVTDDVLRGGDYGAREYFQGGAGNDTIDGREGFDLAYYQSSPTGVYVNLSTNIAYDGWGTFDYLNGIEGVSGGDFNDTLIGAAGGDEFFEEFEGRAGDDFIDGNDGFVPFDPLVPVITYDRAVYHNAPVAVFANIDDSVHDNGVVTLQGGQVADGYGGFDTLVGIEGIRGSRFNDTIYGGNAAHDAFEFFEGWAGDDLIDGGSGNDWIFHDYVLHGVNVNLGANIVNDDGWGDTDTLVSIENAAGSRLGDILIGSAGANELVGDEGDDTLQGGGGNDMLIGGESDYHQFALADNDWASFSEATTGVYANLATGIATGAETGTDVLVEIENLRGGAGADTLVGDEGDNRLAGGNGGDLLVGGAGNDLASFSDAASGLNITIGGLVWTASDGLGNTDTMVGVEGVAGGAGNDTLTGNAFDNAFSGGGGGDAISGLGGFDRVSYETSAGPVIINVSGSVQSNVTLVGAYGTVTVQNGTALDGIDGDTVTGGIQAGVDTLSGIEAYKGSANGDLFFGATLSTGQREFYNPGFGNDTVIGGGGAGISVLVLRDYQAGFFYDLTNQSTLPGGTQFSFQRDVGDDKVFETISFSGIEGIVGGYYNDSLRGQANTSNHFDGGAGSDTLDPGTGTGFDVLSYRNAINPIIANLSGGTTTRTYFLADGTSLGTQVVGPRSVLDGYGNSDQVYIDTLINNGVDHFEQLDGSNYNDYIWGGPVANALFGWDGDDLIGGGTNQTTAVASTESAPDTLDGGAGNDRLIFSASTQGFTGAGANVNFQAGTAFSLDGNDVISNFEAVSGTAGADTILGRDDYVLHGMNSRDAFENFQTFAGADSINGGGTSWGQFDIVDFSGFGTAGVTNPTTGASVNLGTNVVTNDGFGSVDLLTANTVDMLVGTQFADTFTGGSSSRSQAGSLFEAFRGNAGADTLNGMGGEDRVDYLNSGAPVVVNLGSTSYTVSGGIYNLQVVAGGRAIDGVDTDTITGGVQFSTDTLLNIEQVRGSVYADTMIGGGTHNQSALTADRFYNYEVFEGVDGNDFIDGRDGTDLASYQRAPAGAIVNLGTSDIVVGTHTVAGGTAHDGYGTVDTLLNIEVLVGSDFDDHFQGGAGDEQFRAGAGNDVMHGGAGNDRLNYNTSPNGVYVDLSAGTAQDGFDQDTQTGGLQSYVDTFTGMEAVRASQHDDTLLGSSGNDVFEGLGGDDSIDGGGGIDTVTFRTEEQYGSVRGVIVNLGETAFDNGAGVTVQGGHARDGYDTSNGGPGIGDDTLVSIERVVGTGFADTLIGGDGDEELFGNDTSDAVDAGDSLVGGGGNDTLWGHLGNDTLDGGAGLEDVLIGGYGNDSYYVNSLSDEVEEDSLPGGGVDTVFSDNAESGPDGYILSAGVENFVRIGANNVEAYGNAQANSMTGNAGNDDLIGQEGNDTLDGAGGNDELIGGDGNDSLLGGSGEDTLTGDAGNDTLAGGGDNDTYFVVDAGDVVTEGSSQGDDHVHSTVNYTLAANVERLTLDENEAALNGAGNAEHNTLSGNSENNSLSGAAGNDTLYGGDGNDTLDGGAGADSLVGSVGDDIYVVDAAGDVIVEGFDEGTDTVLTNAASYTIAANLENATVSVGTGAGITGNDDANVITGNTGNDTLAGAGGNDSLVGGAGSDSLDGGAGIDSMTGGAGNDTYVVDENSDVVVETDANAATGGIDLVISTASSYTLAANVGDLLLGGTASIDGTGNADANLITGNSGDNLLSALGGADIVFGGAGNDTLLGGTENDQLGGEAGDDSLDGGAGNDTMIGGDGNDVFIVNAAGDVVTETNTLIGSGGDDIVHSSVSYTLTANVERLTLEAGALNGTGNALANTIIGNDANNSIDGGAGNDTMTGGLGNDTYVVSAAGDVINELEDQGVDTVFTNAASYTVGENLENVTVTLATGANITGNAVGNLILGGAGPDTLAGGAGDDTIAGGLGNDSLDGGADNDTLDYRTATIAVAVNLTGLGSASGGGQGVDSITGFEAVFGTAFVDTLTGGAGHTLTGGAGNDLYTVTDSGTTIDELAGGGNNDVVTASGVNYTLGENLEALILSGASLMGTGNAGNNAITGTAGNDTLDGAAGNDTMTGGLGNDTYVVGSSADAIIETAVAGSGSADVAQVSAAAFSALTNGANVENFIVTSAGGSSVIGNALNNSMTGGTGNDTLNGDAGNDTLNGGAGLDSLVGGLGNDTYVIDDTLNGAAELQSRIVDTGGIDTVISHVSNLVAMAPQIENLTLAAGAPQAVVGTGNALANYLTGNELNNKLYGGDGNDTLEGGVGNDTLYGGKGADRYIIDAGNDVIIEVGGTTDDFGEQRSASFDQRESGQGLDRISMAGTANEFQGNDNATRVDAGDGSQTIRAGRGRDTLNAGGGNDLIEIEEIGAVVDGGSGFDTIEVSFSYTLNATLEGLTLTGTGNVDGTGNQFANVITGNSGNNRLTGGAGNDTLDGGGGSDWVSYAAETTAVTVNLASGTGGSTALPTATNAGVDSLTGFENIAGGKGGDNLTGDANANEIFGDLGADTMTGGDGNDTYTVDNAGDVVTEAPDQGLDTVRATITHTLAANVENLVLLGTTAINGTGNALDNTLTGNAAANILNGAGGNDTMAGGLGNDTYVIDSEDDEIVEAASQGTDTVTSTVVTAYTLADNVENLTLNGNQTTVDLTGNAANNLLVGGTGNDLLDGKAGNDTMNGGLGNDVYTVDAQGDVIVDAGGTADWIFATVSYNFAANAAIEAAQMQEGIAAINITANGLNNVILGNDGDNLILGGAGNDTILAADGKNTVMGEAGNDSLFGGAGDDLLDGGLGNDSMTGGAGNDTYVLTNGDIVALDASGIDTFIVPLSINISTRADIENVVLTGPAAFAVGNDGHNSLTGTAAANTLIGGLGNDTLVGLAGNDAYGVDSADDVVVESLLSTGGIDTIFVATAMSYTLVAGVENLVFDSIIGANAGTGYGLETNNGMAGAAGNDSLYGLAGNDTLLGNAGDDSLDGGLGNDSMVGGAGNDTYVVDKTTDIVVETTLAGSGVDTIQTTVSNAAGNTFSLAALAAIENVVLGGTVANALGNAASNSLTGTAGNNLLSGALGADTLVGGGGNDTLEGGVGADLLNGGEGIDTATYASELTAVTVDLLAGTATGGDTLTDIENVIGSKLSDVLTGNASANLLDGGLGNDTMDGGDGSDTYVVNSTLDQVNESGTGEADTVLASISYTLANANVENLTLTGTTAINGTGNDGDNVLIGNAAANLLTGGIGNDTADYSDTSGAITLTVPDAGNMSVTGAAGNDTLAGIENVIGGNGGGDWLAFNSGAGVDKDLATLAPAFTGFENLRGTGFGDTLTGNGGNNMLEGGAGADLLTGGEGIDWAIYTGTAAVTADLGAGTPTAVQGGITDTLSGIENLLGGAGGDSLSGDSMGNVLDGGLGNDTLTGLDGGDTYIVNALGDRVFESGTGGTDEIQSAVSIDLRAGITTVSLVVNDADRGNIENVTLTGTLVASVFGNGNDNVLTGNSAANTLSGGAGDDLLDGKAGADSMIGGTGNDSYMVDNVGDKVDETTGDGFDSVSSHVTYALTGAALQVEELFLMGAANVNGTGNALDNHIVGNGGNNSLDGAAGNDNLYGAEGNDTLNGGLGNDTLAGSLGNDLYLVDSLDDSVVEDEDEGLDTVNATLLAGQTWTLASHVENLTLLGLATAHSNGLGNSLSNLMIGNAGNNLLDGGTGEDTLRGLGGNDTYVLNTPDDVVDETIAGSAGIDTVVVDSFSYTLGTNLEHLTFTGGEGYEGVGNALANALTGGAGNDTLSGGAGNDTLNGGAGADSLVGGDGADRYVVDNAGDVIVEGTLAAGGIDTVETSLQSYTLATGLENLVMTWGSGADGYGNAANNVITGAEDDDFLFGDAGNDTLLGGAGSDTLDGGLGNDSMTGGQGDDTYYVNATGDVIVEANNPLGGIDTVFAGAGNSGALLYTLAARPELEHVVLQGAVLNATGNGASNALTGTSGNNILLGMLGNDTLSGGEGNDTLDGGAGTDQLSGGYGNDLFVVDSLDDVTTEAASQGIDTVNATLGAGDNWTLASDVENLVLLGTLASHGTGNGLDNQLTGNGAANSLDGGAGNDTLAGGLGIDTLVGGLGDDVFVFDALDTSVSGDGGADTVKVAGLLGTAAAPFDFGLVKDRLDSIEIIDITGTGNNAIRMNADDVFAIAENAEVPYLLRVDGNTGDFLISNDSWALQGLVSVGDAYYVVYEAEFESQSVTMLVHTDITQSVPLLT